RRGGMESGWPHQPQPSGTSYQPIVLRQIDQEQGKGNVTLVEIRDILGVIRNQQVNAGGGGPRVMLAGFGGGGGTGGWQAPGGGGGGSSGGTSSRPQGGDDSTPQQDTGPVAPGRGGEGVYYDPVTGTSIGGGVGAYSASRGAGGHQGVDIMAPLGSRLYAASDGVITKIGTDNFGQPTITIQ